MEQVIFKNEMWSIVKIGKPSIIADIIGVRISSDIIKKIVETNTEFNSNNDEKQMFEIIAFESKRNILIYDSKSNKVNIYDSKSNKFNIYEHDPPVLNQYISKKLTNKSNEDILIYRDVNDGQYYNTAIVSNQDPALGLGLVQKQPAPMDFSADSSLESIGPPTKTIPTEEKTDNINDISFAFYPSKYVSHDSVTGEITVKDEITNIFATSEENDKGHFKVKSGSVSNVTLSIADIIIAIMKQIQIKSTVVASTNKAFNKFVNESIDKLSKLKSQYSGRDNVAGAYNEMFKIINTLTSEFKSFVENARFTIEQIKSFCIGPSAIKAIMDSCPLGESVLDSIRFNLNSCFEELAVVKNDIEQFIEVFKTIYKPSTKTSTGETASETATGETATGEPTASDTTASETASETATKMDQDIKQKWNTTPNELIKSIGFWTEIEYCRVFQLISSDIVGAVNGLTPLRAIIDNTAFTGFINIPRGSGGQIGLDNNVCIYSLFLYNVFTPLMLGRDSQNFFGMDKAVYYKLIKAFKNKIEQSDEFIITEYDNSIIEQIETSLNSLMELLKDKPDGILKGDKNVKSDKFTHMFNIYKIITMFAQFIKDKDNNVFFTKARDALNESYTRIGIDFALENSTNITWLCFQLTRYQQTQKVYNDNEVYIIPIEPESYDPKAVIAYFNMRKQMYCEYIKNQKNRNIFIKAWYKALSSVYFYEAFAGHDNNSGELVKFAMDVFGSSKYKAPEKKTKDGDYKPTKKNRQGPVDDREKESDSQPNEDEAQRIEFSQFFSQFVKDGNFSEHPDEVIKKVLKNSNCTIFSELIEVPKERILWVVGPTSGNMVNKRELGAGRLPVKSPTVSFMSGIITAAKNGKENTICTTIDLAKYLTKELMNSRSEDIVRKLFPPSEEEERIIYDNQLVEKSLTIAISKNVNTFYIPISSTVDEAAFDKPQSTIYSTGILRFPIDVGNETTMIVTFSVGIDKATISENKLYTHTYISPEQLFTFEEMKGNKSPYAVCLAYFYKKSKEGKIPSDEFNAVFKLGATKNKIVFSDFTYNEINKQTKLVTTQPLKLTATFYDRYKEFLKQFLEKVIQKKDIKVAEKNKYYYDFLTVAIPSISSLDSRHIFTAKKGVGGLWKKLIFTIAGDNINVALNFIATIESIPEIYNNPDKAIQKQIDVCKEILTALFENIKWRTPKFPAQSPNHHLIAAALQVEFSKRKETICLRTVENGEPVLKLANIEDILTSFPEFEKLIKEAEAKGRVGAMGELAPSQLMSMRGPTQSQTPIVSVSQQTIETIEVVDSLNRFKRQGEELAGPPKLPSLDRPTIEELLRDDKRQLQKTYSAINLLEPFFKTEEVVRLLQLEYDTLNKLQKKIKIYESMLVRSSDEVQIGGDDETDYEEIYKLEAQLAELKAQEEELLINMITFTTGPISDLEISKTAALLGPELFEKIAQAQNQAIIEEYNDILKMNAGNVPFGENNKVTPDTNDTMLPEGKTVEDFANNELVMVKYVDGKYQVENADAFFQEFFANYNTPTTIEKAGEVATIAVEKVEEVAGKAVEKVEEVANSAIATYESLTAPAVEESPLSIEEPTKTYTAESIPISIELPMSEPTSEPNFGPTAAAAAGGYKKKTKRQLNNIKKFTKRKGNKNKNKNKNKKLTKRNRRKQIKKTKRRH